MKFQLMEQACGCSTVRSRQGLNGAVLDSASSTRVQSACRPDEAPAMTLCLATEPP